MSNDLQHKVDMTKTLHDHMQTFVAAAEHRIEHDSDEVVLQFRQLVAKLEPRIETLALDVNDEHLRSMASDTRVVLERISSIKVSLVDTQQLSVACLDYQVLLASQCHNISRLIVGRPEVHDSRPHEVV